MSQVEFKIPKPPNETYQEQKQLVEGKDPLHKEKNVIFMIEKMEWVQGQGCLTYFKGAKFPKRYFPTPDGGYAINQIKRLLKLSIPTLVFSRNKNSYTRNFDNNLHFFNTIANRCLIRFYDDNGVAKLETHKRKLDMVCPTTLYVAEFICQCLMSLGVDKNIAVEFGIIVGHIFEYDEAWRAFVQDMCTELDLEKWKKNPRKEFKRLYTLFMERVSPKLVHVRRKVKIATVPFRIALYIPKYKKVIAEHIHLLKNCKFDEADLYWVWRRSDYDFTGVKWEERFKTVDKLESIQVMT